MTGLFMTNITNNKTVAFHTLGCKVNQYDTQAMRERFERAGYTTVPYEEMADVYVVNTCTVTGTGDKKSMQAVRRCSRKNPKADIVVTGCLAQRAAQELKMPGVRLIIDMMDTPEQCFDFLHEFPEKYEQMSIFDMPEDV